VDVLFNELSINGQFPDDRSFWDAIERLMRMRAVARRCRKEIHCSRTLRHVEPRQGVRLEQALGHLQRDKQRAFFSWLDRSGPFWDDSRSHRPDDWLECPEWPGKIVTDTSVGEAAFRALSRISCALVSLTPSGWDYAPVRVLYRSGDEASPARCTALPNWRDPDSLEKGLQGAPPSVRSWKDLECEIARYPNLRFDPKCMAPLDGLPFSDGAVRHILRRLDALNRFAGLQAAGDAQAQERRRLLQDHFVGQKAWFSDSSDDEKAKFRAKMTFRHPDKPGERLFCPWHGKVKIQQIRIHFSWPGPPLHVVYIGQKLTRR